MSPIRAALTTAPAHPLAFCVHLPLFPRLTRTPLSSRRPSARPSAPPSAPHRSHIRPTSTAASPSPSPSPPPTLLEMTPGTPEMRARAAAAAAAHSDKILPPLQASSFAASTDDVTVVDVRTEAQVLSHEINGVAGVAVRWSVRRSLDDMVAGTEPLPRGRVLLCCSRGPKSLVALDYLVGAMPKFGSQLFVVEGGIEAWDEVGLPIVKIK